MKGDVATCHQYASAPLRPALPPRSCRAAFLWPGSSICGAQGKPDGQSGRLVDRQGDHGPRRNRPRVHLPARHVEPGREPLRGPAADQVLAIPDGMDPHDSSGIPNFAFYKAATAIGGKSWEKAGKIWYQALTGFAPSPNMKMKVVRQPNADAGRHAVSGRTRRQNRRRQSLEGRRPLGRMLDPWEEDDNGDLARRKTRRAGRLRGGRARIRSRGQIDTATLSAADQKAVDSLFQTGRRLGSREGADDFRFRISRTTAVGTETVEAPETHVPAALASCVKDEFV